LSFDPVVIAIDAAITHGTLDTGANFTSEMPADVASARHAVLFTTDAGTLAGHTFLVIDRNGTTGYQDGQDLLIELTGGLNLASLSTGSFDSFS
jgi:hypothetical protein